MQHFICWDFDFISSISEKINLIKKNNFDGVFIFYKDNLNDDISALKAADLEIETMHLPYENCNCLWADDNSGEEYVQSILKGIEKARDYQIKTVVFHVSSSNEPPLMSEVGLNRMKRIINACEKYKINLALENLRRLDYLDYVFQNFKSEYLKFCFDSGHANAFTKNIDDFPWEKYQDKLVCLHLHDNNGCEDSHQIPLIGTINWQLLMTNLKKINYKGPLTSEACNFYEQFTPEDFVKKVKEALKILESYL